MSQTPQTTSARRSAEAELQALIEAFAPANSALTGTVRKWMRKRLPTAHEVVYEYRDCVVISYSPGEHGYEGVFALRASADGVLLYFNQGKDLPDPSKLLKGSGKQTRSIKVESASTLALPEVATLVDAALARNPVAYERTGSGSVVVRSTTASKRRQATPSKEQTT